MVMQVNHKYLKVMIMSEIPNCEELEERIQELEPAEFKRKRADKTLQKSEEWFRLAFRTSPDSININRVSDGMYIDINDGFTKIMGYTREDVIGKASTFLNIWKKPEDRKQLVDGLSSTGYVENLEAQFVGKDGKTIVGLMSARIMHFNSENVILSITRDITERKKTEKALLDSEARLKALSDASFEAIFFSEKGVCLDQNKTAERIFGYTHAEAIGRHGTEWIVPEDREKVKNNMLSRYEKPYEVTALRKDGKTFPCEIQARMTNYKGRPIRITSLRDITERKQVEEALIESEEKNRSLANNINVGIFRNTEGSEGKFIEANPAIVKMFGFDSREEFLKVRVTDLYKNPNDRKKYNEKLLKAGAVKNEELQLQKKDGTAFIGSISAVVVKNKKDKVKYYDGIIEDITERKRAEVRIWQSEKKYRTVLEANPDPVVVYDIEGKVVYFNPAFTSVFGWTLEERLEKKNDTFVPEEAWRETKMMIDKVLAGERFSGIETCRYNKKGEIIPVSISGAIYKDQNGDPIGSIINLRDISGQKKMEAQLQQSQKMEAIGTLAGGIAHDFNNMLFPLMGYSEMLREELPADSPLQHHVNRILEAAMRSKGLVEQILAFSRQGHQEIKLMKLQPIVKESIKLLRSSIPTTIDIQQDIDPGCGAVVADPTQVHQIVMNLATNSYHAMEDSGGRLKVHLKQVRMEPDPSLLPDLTPGEYARLTVADTGIGIEKDAVNKIFDPYFTTKETGKGTGLGLSVVQGIVKRCHGDIRIYSEPGKGTEIQVYLPIHDRKIEDIRIDQSEAIQGGTEKILLVDDEVTIVRMEQRILERLGYRVAMRTGSVDALEAFKANPDTFDLVVTDMNMPNMTGVQLAREIKKVRPEIPIILCTGFSYQVNEEKSKALGIQGFLVKPVIKKEIAGIIRKVLDKLNKC